MSDTELASLLIPAVGGQGGGVLSEWVVDAAQEAGLVASGTSIPGVAQRTGSTSYYVEIFAGREDDPPTFSLYPVPGALDVLLAPELLEVGRMIELGFPSPSRTTIIASTHRLYSIHEKITTRGSVYPSAELIGAARAFSRRLVAFDALALAREHGTEANAVLLGALAGSGVLPIPIDAYRTAIQKKGIQVAANLAGFDLGVERARSVAGTETSREPSRSKVTPDGDRLPQAFIDAHPDAARFVAGLAEPVRGIVSLAVERLLDYQDLAYVLRYLDRLRPFVGGSTADGSERMADGRETGADVEIATTVARLLAVWMTYEDAIRVADLKTRLGRFERIRRDLRADGGEIVVTDYLKPELDEIYGILPHRLVAPFARWAERRWPHGRPTLGQHVKTTTVTGYLRLWLLARLRPLRPHSYRACQEHERMERWLAAVSRCAKIDRALGAEVARAAGLVKGYGEVRRRMFAAFDDLLASVLRAVDLQGARDGEASIATALARRYRELVLGGPEGEGEAASRARAVVARLEVADRSGAASLIEGA